MITKSVAGVAAGVLLVGGGALATAQADSSPSTTELKTAARAVTGPAIITRADDSAYPDPTRTTTTLRIRSRVEYRAETLARIVVGDGAADGNPPGTVTLEVAGRTKTATLRRGTATMVLPRSLQPGEYAARADFTSADDTLYRDSFAVVRFRVVKAGSSTLVNAARVSRGERPAVRVVVQGDNFVTPRGPVAVRITTRGERHTERAHLFNGQAVVRFPKVDRRGRWDVRAVYGGSRVVQRSVGTDRFRVTR